MDDYHEFKHAHEIQIEEWRLYWSSNYVSITRGIVAPSGAMTILGISSTMEAKMPMVVEPLEVVELLGVVVHGHPLVHEVHCSYLTQLWNSSVSYDRITKGLGLKNYGICKISNISPMRVCDKLMHRCVG